MCTSVKERLVAFIEFKGLSKNRFETMCGLSKRYVSNISKSIQPEICKKISLVFPDLNTGWLMTGEGEMLRPQPALESDEPLIFSGDAKILVMQMSATLHQQEANIAKLAEMVDRLTGGAEKPKKESAG